MTERHPHVRLTGRCVYCDERSAQPASDYCRTCHTQLNCGGLSSAQWRALASLETTGVLTAPTATRRALEVRGIVTSTGEWAPGH